MYLPDFRRIHIQNKSKRYRSSKLSIEKQRVCENVEVSSSFIQTFCANVARKTNSKKCKKYKTFELDLHSIPNILSLGNFYFILLLPQALALSTSMTHVTYVQYQLHLCMYCPYRFPLTYFGTLDLKISVSSAAGLPATVPVSTWSSRPTR